MKHEKPFFSAAKKSKVSIYAQWNTTNEWMATETNWILWFLICYLLSKTSPSFCIARVKWGDRATCGWYFLFICRSDIQVQVCMCVDSSTCCHLAQPLCVSWREFLRKWDRNRNQTMRQSPELAYCCPWTGQNLLIKQSEGVTLHSMERSATSNICHLCLHSVIFSNN